MIVDSVAGEGPIVGIRSALAAHPEVAWLVLACDLPFLSDAVIEGLLRERDPSALATAYRSAHDGLPEPLVRNLGTRGRRGCSPNTKAGGGHCPRKFLIRHGAHLLELADPRALDNVNTPEEYCTGRCAPWKSERPCNSRFSITP